MQLRARKVNSYNLFASHAWYTPGVGGMFTLLAWFLVGNLLGALVMGLFGLFMPASSVQAYGMLVVYPLAFIPAMIYAGAKSQRNSLFDAGYQLDNNHFGPFKGWQIALLTVLLTFGTMISADYPNYLNFKLTTAIPGLKAFYDLMMESISSLTGGPFWSSFLLAAIFAPLFEEWLCRGMVLRGLLTKMKPGWAIVVSALFFAVIHMNPWQALNAFIIGVVMGYVYYRTGSLRLTMLMHFVNNGFAVICAHIPSLEEYDYWFEMMGKGTYIAVYVLGLAALAVCLWAFGKIPMEQKRGNIDEVTLSVEG